MQNRVVTWMRVDAVAVAVGMEKSWTDWGHAPILLSLLYVENDAKMTG